jgi:hypothetical protein
MPTNAATDHETKITDIEIAAYLVAVGQKLVRLEGPSTRRAFVFADVPSDVLMAFYHDAPCVAPRQILTALRQLKTLVHQPL